MPKEWSNREIRELVVTSGITWRAIAQEVGIAPNTMRGWLTKPLTIKQQTRVISAINALGKAVS